MLFTLAELQSGVLSGAYSHLGGVVVKQIHSGGRKEKKKVLPLNTCCILVIFRNAIN